REPRRVHLDSEGGRGNPVARVCSWCGLPDREWLTGTEQLGTALKPAFEPIVLARKPLAEKTVARNVLAHGTGAINIDACRIGTEENLTREGSGHGMLRLHGCHTIDELRALAEAGEKTPDGRDARATLARAIAYHERVGEDVQPSGRWPANVLLDQHTATWVDEQSGGASRFFYTAKAPKRERPNV